MDDLKKLLRDKADDMHLDPDMPSNIRPRVRRRRIGNALVTGVVVLAIGVSAFAGAAQLVSNQAEPRPANPPADRTFTFVVPSDAMLPTYAVGDVVEIEPTERRPARGEVILFSDPNAETTQAGAERCLSLDYCFLKRVIGLPGETIEIRDGKVFVDANVLSEPYARLDSSTFGPIKVAAGTFFVMGDNRANSSDSRSLLGPIPQELILGTVVADEPVPGPSPSSESRLTQVPPTLVNDNQAVVVDIVAARQDVEAQTYFRLLLAEDQTREGEHLRYDVVALSEAPERPARSGLFCNPEQEAEARHLRDTFFPGAEIRIQDPPAPAAIQIVLGHDFLDERSGQLHVFRFVDDFMEARTSGEGAEQFLYWYAAEQYQRGENGLSLYGYTSNPRVSFDVTSWREIGEGGFVARVQINTSDEVPPSETLHIESEILTDPDSPKAEIGSAERTQ